MGSWCSAQLLSRVVLGGGLLQSWQSGGTVGRTVGQRFLLDRVLALWHWCCFRGTVVCSLGIMFRLPVLSLGDRRDLVPVAKIVGLVDLSDWQFWQNCVTARDQIRVAQRMRGVLGFVV